MKLDFPVLFSPTRKFTFLSLCHPSGRPLNFSEYAEKYVSGSDTAILTVADEQLAMKAALATRKCGRLGVVELPLEL